jgi:hypothetical protein
MSHSRAGAVDILVQLENAQEAPFTAQGLSVSLANPDMKIAAITANAERVESDKWHVRMSATTPGKWSLSLGVQIAPDDRVDMEAPILIER